MKSTYAEVGRTLVTLERVNDAEVGLQVKQFLQVGVGVKQLGGLGCRVQLGHQANCHDKHRHEESWNNRKEGNVLFNGALNTFYLRLYGVGYMVKDHSDSDRGNSLPPHVLICN